MERGEDGASLGEVCHVLVIIVGRVIFPATEQDTDPFEGQSTNDGCVLFPFVGVVFDIIASPLAFDYREARKLMKGLPVELGTGPAHIDRFGFTAAFSYRSNSAKTLDVVGARVTGAVGSKKGQEPWSHCRAGAGQPIKKISFGVFTEELLDALLVLFNDRIECADHLGIGLSEPAAAFDERWVGGQWLGAGSDF